MIEQRFTFDEVPELYDRSRPRYPEVLFDDLLSLAGTASGARILEIGCGTGQATIPLLQRGFQVLSLEPGTAMARFAREKLLRFPKASVIESTFEAWPVERGAFHLVVSAQAFHWVAAEIRFAKAAASLAPVGALAIIGNAVVPERSSIRADLDAVYARHAPNLAGPAATRWYSKEGPVRDLFAASGCFGPVSWRRYPWSQVYSSSEYCDLLRTHSDHRLLPEARRDSLLAALAAVVEAHGGRLEIAYDAHLYVARPITASATAPFHP